jgi:hypothetical protein
LGLTQVHRPLFTDIEWSSARVCDQTRQRAAELGLAVTLLEPWYDVDDEAGLRQLDADLARADACNEGERAGIYGAHRTRAALAGVAAPRSSAPASASARQVLP